MKRILQLKSIAILTALVSASVADARGGGGMGGGGRGGGMGGGGRGGGMGGGGRGTGGMGGMGGMGRGTGFGSPGGGGRFGSKNGGTNDQALGELEDRKSMITERRHRMADSERETNQENRLAASRVAAAVLRAGDDIR